MDIDQKAISKIKENTKIGEDILFEIIKYIKLGITTYEINQIAKREFERNKALPSAKFLGSDYYISVAINEEILFGQISKAKKIKSGDILKIALGVFKNGYFSDLGFTLVVGKSSQEKERLLRGTAIALLNTIENIKENINVKKISFLIENSLKKYRLEPICEIAGHGVGRNLHEPPAIPNCLNLPFINYNSKLRKDFIVCIEPIATLGKSKVIRKNKYSYAIKDGFPVAHFEVPIWIKKKKSEVLAKRIFEKIKLLE